MGLHLTGSSVTQLNNAFARLSGVQAVVSADGALVPGAHNPVDATSGNRTVTLADAPSAGLMVAVSKKDATANTVTVSVAHLRDGGAGTIVLVGQFEALLLTSKADGSWWPVGDHKTKAYFDATYAPKSTVASTSQTADYTLALGDAGTVVEVNKATAVTVTVPPESSVAWATGTVLELLQLGAGQVTVAAGAGVTLRAPLGAKSAMQYGSLYLRKRATNEWLVNGDVTT